MQKLPVDSDGYLTEEIFDLIFDLPEPRKRRFPWSKKVRATDADTGVDGPADELADQFIAWAAHRYDARLTRAEGKTLLGLDEVGNSIQLDGKEIMMGTPSNFEPGERFGLIEPVTRLEPRHRG